tara:strand:- start:1003 stop:1149 length:147 start_codon:yes stop_codon:yes gene_type:complete
MTMEERTPSSKEDCSRMMTFLSDFAATMPAGVPPTMIIFQVVGLFRAV